jgi:hypothetical protein
MADIYSQELLHFSKLNHVYLCAKAHSSRDIKNFCRHFFYAKMDRHNLVKTSARSISGLIQNLTGWKIESIKDAINRLAKDGELEKLNQKEIRINDMIANRVAIVLNHNGYNGLSPAYSPEELKLIEEIRRVLPDDLYAREKVEEMTMLLKRIDKQSEELRIQSEQLRNQSEEMKALNEKLQFVIDNFVKPQDRDQARLVMIKGGKE